MTIVVFDIDGVLADATHREHFVLQRPKDWDAFFAAVGQDAVIEAGRNRLLAAARDHEIVLVSGRPERTRTDTQSWLDRNGMGSHRLVLRPDDDRRRAAVAKLELVEALAAVDSVAAIVDDDPSVVEALTARGYPAEVFPPADPLI